MNLEYSITIKSACWVDAIFWKFRYDNDDIGRDELFESFGSFIGKGLGVFVMKEVLP